MKYNPHKRLREIKEELKPLEEEEKVVKEGSRRAQEIKDSIFWLVIEMIEIKKILTYFRQEFKKIEKKYPEHYWRWQFYGKVINPEEEN